MGEGLFKQRNGMIAVDVMAACGVMTPEQWRALGEAAGQCEVFRFKLTTRQTVVAVLPEEKVPAFIEALAEAGLKVSPYKKTVRPVKGCAGHPLLCPRAIADALTLGITLQEKFTGQEVPKDFKIAVAGCARGCTDPQCADFGARASGSELYDVFIGGRGGTVKPVHGVQIARRVPPEKVEALLNWVLERYRQLAQPYERLCQTMARVGVEAFLPPAELVEDKQAEIKVVDEFAAFLQG